MKSGFSFVKGAVIALAAVGVAFPETRLLADQATTAKVQTKVVAANSVFDIRMGQGGEFSGRTVDHTGTPVEGAKIVLKQGNKQVAETVTDHDGQFAISNLHTGVYQVSSGATEGTFRLWSERTAPPSAKAHGLLVLGENGARGQYGMYEGGSTLLTAGVIGLAGLATTGLVVGVNANRQARHAANDASKALKSL